ncbi:adrenodoxin-NADP+ reductase [Nematocida ausubeli]|nr:adrenodoxin-NADP+ reductase [Nematocida ausubeli]
MHICIIGAGPAAAYFIKECLIRSSAATFDVFEQSSKLLGNLRKGVAPDQHRIRETIPALEKIFLSDRRVSLHRGMRMGTDISLKDVQKKYDAVVIATGAEPNTIAVPGAEHIIRADQVMEWISENRPVSANGRIAVLGHGNVALDVARALLHAQRMGSSSLSGVQVEEVDVIGRSPPDLSKFTTPVLAEFLSHPTSISISERVCRWIRKVSSAGTFPRAIERKALLLSSGKKPTSKTARFIFWEAPTQVNRTKTECGKRTRSEEEPAASALSNETLRITNSGYKYTLTTVDDRGVERKAEYDGIVSAVGYKPRPLQDLLEGVTVPVYRVGWASTEGRGTLADAYVSAIETASALFPDEAAHAGLE